MRVWYTAYDVTRDYDTINPTSRRTDIMVLSREASASNTTAGTAFWYARVIGVYHVNVIHPSFGTHPKRMDFLHVRWLGSDPDWRFGNRHSRLERIGFVPDADDAAFGFLDPDLVIRGAHLLPASDEGRTNDLLGPSRLARLRDGAVDDWRYFYVAKSVFSNAKFS